MVFDYFLHWARYKNAKQSFQVRFSSFWFSPGRMIRFLHSKYLGQEMGSWASLKTPRLWFWERFWLDSLHSGLFHAYVVGNGQWKIQEEKLKINLAEWPAQVVPGWESGPVVGFDKECQVVWANCIIRILWEHLVDLLHNLCYSEGRLLEIGHRSEIWKTVTELKLP